MTEPVPVTDDTVEAAPLVTSPTFAVLVYVGVLVVGALVGYALTPSEAKATYLDRVLALAPLLAPGAVGALAWSSSKRTEHQLNSVLAPRIKQATSDALRESGVPSAVGAVQEAPLSMSVPMRQGDPAPGDVATAPPL